MANTMPDFLCFNPIRRDHARVCKGGFYDVETSDRRGGTADYLEIGDVCLVATPAKDGKTFEFGWFSFLREGKMVDPDDGSDIRVLFGTRKKLETHSRAYAIKTDPYSKFFKTDGGLKRGMTIMWGSKEERHRRQRERRRGRQA